MKRTMKRTLPGFILLCLGIAVCGVFNTAKAQDPMASKTKIQMKLQEQEKSDEGIKARREAAQKEKRQTGTEQEIDFGLLNLPEDTSTTFAVKELRISGNTLISTENLLSDLPLVYNASNNPLYQAEPGDLYDFRILHEIIAQPGRPRQVSRRTMQGLTQYILSVYRAQDYAGIYIYISAQAFDQGVELWDGILPIEVVETKVSEIKVTAYDPQRNKREESILRSSIIEEWSPVQPGEMVDKKKLDDFVNLLNLNPDRYLDAVISRGAEPNTIAVTYDIYEADPWHFYIQLDNAGTDERQWAPRLGFINTNLTGIDDRLTGVAQGALDSADENYLSYASYEFPLFTPRLRLNLYGGRNEFDISGGGGVDFLGIGSFYGGLLRFNVLQSDGWYFDITNSLSHEKSKVTPSLFTILETDIDMDLWTLGAELYRTQDMSTTSFTFNRVQSYDGSSKADFQDARQETDPDFDIYTVTAAHSQYLDQHKINRLSASSRWITSTERLAPSKMTTFGGLYSVRGYEEDEIVADGGLLFSAQYEFDLVKHNKSKETESNETQNEEPGFTKLALLSFFDFARAKVKDPVAGEKKINELCSLGLGTSMTFGKNLDAGIYYGFPLRSTADTKSGHGRWSFSFLMRW